jgi:hypothetical protein
MGAGELPSMNAQALLKYWPWHEEPKPTPEPKSFPPEAYSYDSPIEKDAIAAIQREADKVLDKQQWTVIERLGESVSRR